MKTISILENLLVKMKENNYADYNNFKRSLENLKDFYNSKKDSFESNYETKALHEIKYPKAGFYFLKFRDN